MTHVVLANLLLTFFVLVLGLVLRKWAFGVFLAEVGDLFFHWCLVGFEGGLVGCYGFYEDLVVNKCEDVLVAELLMDWQCLHHTLQHTFLGGVLLWVIVDDHILDEVAGRHFGVTHLVGVLVLGVEEVEGRAHGGRMLGQELGDYGGVGVNVADGELGEEGDNLLAVGHSLNY